jgi:hypothetical protein
MLRSNARTFAVLLWLAATSLGFWCFECYKAAPGGQQEAPVEWPAESTLRRSADHPTLILFAHPHCPCTAASLHELERLVALERGRVEFQVMFVKPPGVADGWVDSGLWDAAGRIPGVHVSCDEDGRQARLFGAATSGQVVLYSPRGELLFSGGITPSRGHEGDSPGRVAILDILASRPPLCRQTPVFGCSLLAPGATSLEE